MEALRVHLGVGRWTLLGGSWGVALSLAYAAAHPASVRALVLRGVCLMRRSEIDWAFRAGGAAGGTRNDGSAGLASTSAAPAPAPAPPEVPLGGAAALYPAGWAAFCAALGVPPAGGADPVAVAYAALCGDDVAARARVAGAWMRWGGAIGTAPPAGGVQTWDGARWVAADAANTAAGSAALAAARTAAVASPPPAIAPPTPPPAPATSSASTQASPSNGFEAQCLLEAHYCLSDGFLSSPPLLARIPRIRAADVPIPAVAVHGRLDALCPVGNAYALHAAWPELELRVVGGAGHSMYEAGITHELLCALDAFRALPL
jgi:proline iminopeptidase